MPISIRSRLEQQEQREEEIQQQQQQHQGEAAGATPGAARAFGLDGAADPVLHASAAEMTASVPPVVLLRLELMLPWLDFRAALELSWRRGGG